MTLSAATSIVLDGFNKTIQHDVVSTVVKARQGGEGKGNFSETLHGCSVATSNQVIPGKIFPSA